MRAMNRGTVLGAATAGALAAAVMVGMPSMAAAQGSVDGAWLPFLGCWSDVEAPAEAPLTCVVPAENGVEVLTVSADGIVERQPLRADGVERAFASGGCEGVQSAEPSADGRRIYTTSRLACDGGTERSTRGIIAMVDPNEWVDIRALTVGNGSVSWVKRYRAAAPRQLAGLGLTDSERAELDAVAERQGLAIETARMAASAAPTVDGIIEASARTDAEAVRAWIAEQDAPLRLGADELVRLADAGVERAVIDVAVAVSYPERFALARQSDRRPDAEERWDRRGYEWDRYRYGSWYYDPFYYDPFYNDRYLYGRTPYGYGSGYGRGISFYGPGWYGGPSVIIVRPVERDAQPRQGRMVKGGGYTAGSPSSDGARAVPSTPSSSSGGGSAVRSGGSSTSSSGSKGKAKPKDG